MTPQGYHDWIQQQIGTCPVVIGVNVSFRQINASECYLKGELNLLGNFRLSFAEYVIVQPDVQRLKYRYQLMDRQGNQMTRWDNAPHHPQLANFPYHKHDQADNPSPSPAMNLNMVLAEAAKYVMVSLQP